MNMPLFSFRNDCWSPWLLYDLSQQCIKVPLRRLWCSSENLALINLTCTQRAVIQRPSFKNKHVRAVRLKIHRSVWDQPEFLKSHSSHWLHVATREESENQPQIVSRHFSRLANFLFQINVFRSGKIEKVLPTEISFLNFRDCNVFGRCKREEDMSYAEDIHQLKTLQRGQRNTSKNTENFSLANRPLLFFYCLQQTGVSRNKLRGPNLNCANQKIHW